MLDRLLATLLVTASLAACAAAPAPASPSAAPPSAVGHVDASVAEAIATYAGANKVELYLDRGGRVTKASVYHADAARGSAAAKAAVARELPGATIRHFEMERCVGEEPAVEVEVERADKRACEVSLTHDGALRYVESKVPVAELPKAIGDEVAKLLPGGAIDEVEQVKSPKGDAWQVDVKRDGVVHVLRFGASGALESRGLQLPAKVTVELR